MLAPGTMIIIDVDELVTKPQWYQSPGHEPRVFTVWGRREHSTEEYAWYETDKGTLVVTDHSLVTQL